MKRTMTQHIVYKGITINGEFHVTYKKINYRHRKEITESLIIDYQHTSYMIGYYSNSNCRSINNTHNGGTIANNIIPG